jgi:hypothetical protein
MIGPITIYELFMLESIVPFEHIIGVVKSEDILIVFVDCLSLDLLDYQMGEQ